MVISPQFSDRFFNAVMSISQNLSSNSNRAESARYLKFSPQAFQTLRWLSITARPTPSGLAIHLGVAPATITSLLDRLAQSDLVARAPSARDRRKIALSLTARGRRAVAAINAEDRANCAPLLDVLAAEERATLLQNLEQMTGEITRWATPTDTSQPENSTAAPKRGLLRRKERSPKPVGKMATDRRIPTRRPR